MCVGIALCSVRIAAILTLQNAILTLQKGILTLQQVLLNQILYLPNRRQDMPRYAQIYQGMHMHRYA